MIGVRVITDSGETVKVLETHENASTKIVRVVVGGKKLESIMSLDDLRDHKKKLEEDLKELLTEFYKKTSVPVKTITVTSVTERNLRGSFTRYNIATVDVELEGI